VKPWSEVDHVFVRQASPCSTTRTDSVGLKFSLPCIPTYRVNRVPLQYHRHDICILKRLDFPSPPLFKRTI